MERDGGQRRETWAKLVRAGEGGADRPPVVPRAPSLWSVSIPRRALSEWSQGGTAAPVVEFLDHDLHELRGWMGKKEEERKGSGRGKGASGATTQRQRYL